MRNFILIMFVSAVTLVWAGETAPESKGPRVVQIESGKAKKEYKTKSYTVREETDIVERALNVFKKKGQSSSLYKKKVWIYATPEEDNASYLSFMTNDQNEGVVFSPDEDFVYYVEISPDGRRRLKGVKVGSEETFFVDATVESFFIETCEEQGTSYLVVLDGSEVEGYDVYDLRGQLVVLPDMPADVNYLKEFICY